MQRILSTASFILATAGISTLAHGAPTPTDQVFFDNEAEFNRYFSTPPGNRTNGYRTRLITGSADKAFTVVVDGCKVSDVTIDETERKSRISSDVSTLVSKLIGGAGGAAAADAANYCTDPANISNVDHQAHYAVTTTHTYKYTRSTLKITANGNDAAKTVLGEATVLTGPPELAYLSLDLPVSNRSVLKYNSANGGSLQPSDSNPQFYLGVNFQAGDLLTPPAGWFDKNRLSLKLMIQASSKPLDSFGVGLGYTLPEISVGFLNGVGLSSFTIFGGHFWTKQDAIVNGIPQTDHSYASGWRFGISYDLSSQISKVKF